MIGRNIKIQGELSGDEDIVIEGRVEGKISVTKTVQVSESAQINAEIRAQTVIVSGKVMGNVVATEKIDIRPSGSLEGNIRAPKIAIAEGAQFKGSVDMGGKAAPESPASPASSSPPASPTR